MKNRAINVQDAEGAIVTRQDQDHISLIGTKDTVQVIDAEKNGDKKCSLN